MTVILVILGAMVLISLKGFQDNLFFNRYLFNPVAILEWKQWDRMLMSGFLHANWPHLLFNGFALYSFSGLVLAYLGTAGFLIIFFGSILLGNFTALVARKHEMHYRAVGASGGAQRYFTPAFTFCLPLSHPLPYSGLVVCSHLYWCVGFRDEKAVRQHRPRSTHGWSLWRHCAHYDAGPRGVARLYRLHEKLAIGLQTNDFLHDLPVGGVQYQGVLTLRIRNFNPFPF